MEHSRRDPTRRSLRDADFDEANRAETVDEAALSNELEWRRLQDLYFRERVRLDAIEGDYVALVRRLLAANDNCDAQEAHDLATIALSTYKRSVALWELKALAASRTGHHEELNAALARIEEIDPTSSVLSLAEDASRKSDDSAPVQHANELVQHANQLLARVQTGGEDAMGALEELQAASNVYPRNSTYLINLALALLELNEATAAQEFARQAVQIEDGSFADSYNIAVVFFFTQAYEEARALLKVSTARARTQQENDLAQKALVQLGDM